MFLEHLPAQLIQFAQENKTGEAIFFNAFVADYLARNDQPQCSGILVYQQKKRKDKLGQVHN